MLNGGLLLREARTRAGLTQTELAARVGVAPAAISRWERGKVSMSIDRLDELMAGCGLELDVALRRRDDSDDALVDAARAATPTARLAWLMRSVTTLAQLHGTVPGPFDPQTLLTCLAEGGVEFVIVGGVASVLQGDPHPTFNVDIVVRPGVRNAGRLPRALAQLEAAPVDSVPGVARHETLHGQLQLVDRPVGTHGYDDLVRDADTMDLGGVSVQVASLAAVIRCKDALARPGDRAAVGAFRSLAAREAAA